MLSRRLLPMLAVAAARLPQHAGALRRRGGGAGSSGCAFAAASARQYRARRVRHVLAASQEAAADAVAAAAAAAGDEAPTVKQLLKKIKTPLALRSYPDPALRAPNREVDKPAFTAELKRVARAMFDVMYATSGVGLAAPQVGVNLRLMVFNQDADPSAFMSEVVLVNPVIVERSDDVERDLESCLSFPDMSGHVDRAAWVKVEALSLKGKAVKRTYKGYEARIFQHEFDHLTGTVYVDHLDAADRDAVEPKLDALFEAYGEGAAR